MKKIILILLLLSNAVQAQMLDNSLGEAFGDAPFFNSRYIKSNRIKQISGNFIHKKMGDVIRDTELIRTYAFDKKGRLSQTYKTTEAKVGFDTVVTQYEYDDANNVTVVRKSDQFGFNASYFQYDEKGRVVREEFRRNLNQNDSRINFELGEEYIVTFETWQYQEFDGQEKKTCYNSYGKPFKDVITYFDEQGFITEKVDRLHRTSGVKSTKYFYNEKALVDSMIVDNKQVGNSVKSYSFVYDNLGNLDTKNIYKDNVHTTQIQIIYNDATLEIDYILTIQMDNNYMTILKLSDYIRYGYGNQPDGIRD